MPRLSEFMNKTIKRAVINAFCTLVYIVLVVLLIFSLQNPGQPDGKNILIPISMLLLFVCSAAITGFLFFGKPVMLYIDGKKNEAIKMLTYTIGILVFATIISFGTFIIFFR